MSNELMQRIKRQGDGVIYLKSRRPLSYFVNVSVVTHINRVEFALSGSGLGYVTRSSADHPGP